MSSTNILEIEINGEKYIRKSEVQNHAPIKDGMKYQIVRAEGAGVFAGYVESITDALSGRVAIMRDLRRLWYWSGAASLSQLAVDGTCKPNDCKFPCVVSRAEISKVIEVIDCTDKAKKSIEGVKVWEQK